MCYTAKLPTVITEANTNSPLLEVTYIFNRWMRMLLKYGKLDEATLTEDFNAISAVIKADGFRKTTKRAVAYCRSCAISQFTTIGSLKYSIENALKHLCNEQEDRAVKKVRKAYADQGMTEKYRPLSRRLEREKIRRIGKTIAYTDADTDDAYTTKLVRRIVEKRAAQAVHRNTGGRKANSNSYRQAIRRATSFSLYNSSFTDYDAAKRSTGTHWKVAKSRHKSKKQLKSKVSFSTLEEAQTACERYMQEHSDQIIPMTAYYCEHCGKWHIGHDHRHAQYDDEQIA